MLEDLHGYVSDEARIRRRKLQFILTIDLYSDVLASVVEDVLNGNTYLGEIEKLKKSLDIADEKFDISFIDLQVLSLLDELGGKATLDELTELSKKYTSQREIWKEIMESYMNKNYIREAKKIYEQLSNFYMYSELLEISVEMPIIHGYIKMIDDKTYEITDKGKIVNLTALYIANNIDIPPFYKYLLTVAGHKPELEALKIIRTL